VVVGPAGMAPSTCRLPGWQGRTARAHHGLSPEIVAEMSCPVQPQQVAGTWKWKLGVPRLRVGVRTSTA
jgi:hypothetical protein